MERQDKVEMQEINLLELMQVVVKRKMFIVKASCVAMALSAACSLVLPDIYSATAKVLPPQKESGGLSALLGSAGGLAGLAGSLGGLGGSSDLYLGMLKSRSVADAVIKRLDLTKVYEKKTMDETRKKLESKVKMSAGKDGLISIIAEDKDPKRAALLANAFVDELGKTTVRLNLSKAGTERMFLEKRLEVVKKDLQAAEENVKSFAQSNRVVAVDAQARAAIEGIARLKAELAAKEVQLSVLQSKQTDESPDVQAIQVAIGRLKNEIGRLAGGNSSGQGIPSVGSVPAIGMDYMRRMRELKTQEAIFEQLTKQYEVAKLGEAKDSSALQVLDEAVVPLKKSKPHRALIVLLATIAAMFVSTLGVFVLEYLERMPENDRKLVESIKRQALAFK
jgi:tyrosine-protein kinase Etk/Wzc